MAQMKRPRLKKVEAVANYILRLTFVDDTVYSVSLEELFTESPASHLSKTLQPSPRPPLFRVKDGQWNGRI